jgi:hypothetical protein
VLQALVGVSSGHCVRKKAEDLLVGPPSKHSSLSSSVGERRHLHIKKNDCITL